MPYKANFRRPFKNNYKKIKDEALKTEVEQVIAQIMANPTSFELLKGNLAGFQSAHFHRSPEYRIFFKRYECRAQNKKNKKFYCEIEQHESGEEISLEDCAGMIDLIFFDTREEFNKLYKLTAKELKNFLF